MLICLSLTLRFFTHWLWFVCMILRLRIWLIIIFSNLPMFELQIFYQICFCLLGMKFNLQLVYEYFYLTLRFFLHNLLWFVRYDLKIRLDWWLFLAALRLYDLELRFEWWLFLAALLLYDLEVRLTWWLFFGDHLLYDLEVRFDWWLFLPDLLLYDLEVIFDYWLLLADLL